MTREFEGDLTRLIAKYEMGKSSNTPDWIMAKLVMDAIETYTTAVSTRDTWAKHPDWVVRT